MIHSLADVQTIKIGHSTDVWQFSVILAGAVIGENCNVNCHTFIENNVVVGNNVTIKAGVFLWDGIRVEDNVFIGPNVTFTNDKVPKSKQYPNEFQKTVIERNASIGANATILGGIEIGQFALVGASSLVTKNVPPFTIWFGSPAVHKGYITKDGILLNMDLRDKDGKQYYWINKELT